MKKCPFCAEDIQDAAIKCRYCLEFLDPSRRPAMAAPPPLPPPAAQPSLPWYFRTGNIILALLCVGPLALPMIWFHPKLSATVKLWMSIVVVILTAALLYATIWSLRSIASVYEQAFNFK